MNVRINLSIAILGLLLLVAIFFKWGFERLQEQRLRELDKVESREKSKKSYLPAVFHSITAKVRPETAGLVKGIVYSKNMSNTVISDNNSILHEENTIHGITIIKIHKDKVEFAKNGQRWTQKVGEPPDPEWYK